MPPLVILIVSLWGFRLPFATLLMPRFGADAIWWSFPLAGALSALLAIMYYHFGHWRQAHMLTETHAADLNQRPVTVATSADSKPS